MPEGKKPEEKKPEEKKEEKKKEERLTVPELKFLRDLLSQASVKVVESPATFNLLQKLGRMQNAKNQGRN